MNEYCSEIVTRKDKNYCPMCSLFIISTRKGRMKKYKEKKCKHCGEKFEIKSHPQRIFCCSDHQRIFQKEKRKKFNRELAEKKNEIRPCGYSECTNTFESKEKRRKYCCNEHRVLAVQEQRKKQRKFNIIAQPGKMKKRVINFQLSDDITRADIEKATAEFLKKKQITKIETPVFSENPYEREYVGGQFINVLALDEL